MGTMLTATAWGRDSSALDRALEAAADSVRLVDSLLSTYQSESEVSRINRGAGSGEQGVSEPFAAVLGEALRVAEASGGAFDPTLRDWRRVHFDAVRRTVRLEAGMALDFGGIAKGYALDRAAAALGAAAEGAVLNLGGQLHFVGRARAGTDDTRRQVGIVDPDDPNRVLALLAVDSGSVSTSSQAERPGHIVDPRTGMSAGRVRSATVVAATGMAADAWSTAAFVLGCDAALALARAQRLELVCVDSAARWTPGLEGRVALATDSAGLPGRAPSSTRAAGSAARWSTRRW